MMNELSELTLAHYKAVLAPFLMMTSCATLVWALQTRFSRLVQAIRTLVSEGRRDNIDYSHSLAKQIAWLKGRSLLLRNAILALYCAMCCFLLSAMLLAASVLAQLSAAPAVIALFLTGLALICVGLIATLWETSQTFRSLQEELASRQ